MTYKNNVKYTGQYGGIHVTYTLEKFNEKIIDEFNSELVEKAVQHVKEDRQADRCVRI